MRGGWPSGSFRNGLKASRYFLAPLAQSRNVLYYYYYYYYYVIGLVAVDSAHK
jgi:hypothetical protein